MQELQEIQAHRQQFRDVGFLAVLALLLAASAFAVLRSAYPPGRIPASSSGEIRAIDPSTLRQQLRSGRLSKHEAAHWQRVGGARTRPTTPTPGGAP